MCCPDCCDDDGWGECAIECKCYCHDDDGSGDDPDDGPCIGAECCNPHVGHHCGECVTAEQMAEYHAEGEAPTDEERDASLAENARLRTVLAALCDAADVALRGIDGYGAILDPLSEAVDAARNEMATETP